MSSENKFKHHNQRGIKPHHVAIIMDGNGRWAHKKGKLRIFGHQAGVESVRRAVSFAVSYHLDALTLYAFSSENWQRPHQEVVALLELFIRALETEVKNLDKHNIRLNIIGDTSRLSTRLQACIRCAEEKTQHNKGLILNIAVNYGGRWDIIRGVRILAAQVQDGRLHPDQIEEKTLGAYLCLNKMVPVDLVIRTGGECRISNFLLWQVAYAEFWFTEILWPDFDEGVFEGAINAFLKRERRFGSMTI
ncbi:Ditrans,polycis-undecaprenyl-diphosphate synthase ((2E,6E)-farnesyl-diphosphate specific) [Candidatus Erwinia haradaeae]|uniref:Ditrans,polycis-undecaprenyl-diphosphate synthase ((2E,6E)-farnesyl-diphosphate specific) n=1 Tax=Candidatus Erwinia haradaeae TaxID=1922217 RepID=A0A451DCH9_9GAMM|nr:polyprenyl diphosphate synthase [Candidatus Erwinia haradaeae]VFP84097.1 Ditrans,polycis-undecaprenyl-diphosphate synthase ((2E,6E)-farnesyl-diphosphate specific) [Candidatus Erwinia haradaeae]